MEFGEKERQIVLVALRRYLAELEEKLGSDDGDEEVNADLANDASLADILIARFEEER